MTSAPVASGSVDVPDLVPARMVNEFVYCPRLFFLEWVQARFEDNLDTVQGRYTHRVVDQPGGAAPLPEDEEPLRVARSLQLSSNELGVVAKADLVEGSPDGEAVPVDYKKGSPPDNAERSWLPERVQLCIVGLLLREHGYRCSHGFLYFAEVRQRVKVDFDEDLVSTTLGLLQELRATAAADVPPPPLIGSPKCPRCSLVGLCLPDETNAFAGRSERPPRRLLPSDDDAHPLHVTEQGAYIGKDKGLITISKDKVKLHSVRQIDVSQLCIHGRVQISTQALTQLIAEDVPVCFFTYGGWFSGIAHGMPSKHVELRRRQVVVAAQGGLEIARQVVAGKILNSRVLLRRNTRERNEAALVRLKSAAGEALQASSVASLLGIEGAAARTYFGEFASMVREDLRLPGGPFSFEHRNRRPPTDAVNCLLSFGYGQLTKELTTTTFAIGFDPYQGFYHRPKYGRPALALDLAEEFRPLIVESTVLTLINNGEIGEHDFLVRAGGVSLTADGRRAFLRAFDRRMETEVTHPRFGYRITYRRVLDVQARLLGAVLLGEIPEYVPFVTR